MSTSKAPHDEETIVHKQCNGNIANRVTDKDRVLGKFATANGIRTSNSNQKAVNDLLIGESHIETAVEDGGSFSKSVEKTLEKRENVMMGDTVIEISDELSSALKITDVVTSSNVNSNSETNKEIEAITESRSKGKLEDDNLDQDITDSTTLVIKDVLGVTYLRYENEHQMEPIMQLITKDLSEPYSIYTYRYFIHNWPQLCFLARYESEYVGAIVCKLDLHKKIIRRGYIAMLAVDQSVRRKNIGTSLVKTAIEEMDKEGCDEVVLETEVTNKPALKLYENLGFVRDKRLFRYYLNGVDALRLKLWLR